MGLKLSADLRKSFSDLEKQISKQKEEMVKKTIIDTHNEIITKSPVDSGIYRASNFIGVNRTTDDIATDDNIPSSDVDVKDAPSTEYIFYNNVPYAIAIEGGHSKQQAPQGVYFPASRRVADFIAKNAKKFDKIKYKVK
jgi:hypothetical protein